MLGIGIAAGEGVSVGLLVAIFVSNLPEAIGSSTDDARRRDAAGDYPSACGSSSRSICALATVAGYAIADTSRRQPATPAIDGFAAGALLVMLIDSMIPEAVRKGGDVAGLVTVLGFAVAAALRTAFSLMDVSLSSSGITALPRSQCVESSSFLFRRSGRRSFLGAAAAVSIPCGAVRRPESSEELSGAVVDRVG